MKKKFDIWSILSFACILLGIFSLSRVFSELTHHTGTGRSIALHVGSAVLWFAFYWIFGQKRKKEGNGEIPPSELAAAIQKKLALPYKLLPDKVPPDALMRFYRRTRKETAGKGFTPILVPVDEELDRHLDRLAQAGAIPSDETALAAVPADGKAILERRWREVFAAQAETPQVPQTVLGEITGAKEQIHFLSCLEDGAPKETLMLRLPTDEGWKAPSYLPVGGSRGMPETAELLAVCRYWFEKYRAVPAAMGYGTMEFVVPKVIEKEQVMETAKEHFAFCPDRVKRDTVSGTIGELADSLWQSTVWYFRWYDDPEPREAAAEVPAEAAQPSEGGTNP